jgi:hypothetical protein
MNKIVFSSKTFARLHKGPLGFYVDSYLDLLNEQGFSSTQLKNRFD